MDHSCVVYIQESLLWTCQQTALSAFLQGFLYVLNHKGETREGWPIQMGDIQAGAAVTELYGYASSRKISPLLGRGPVIIVASYSSEREWL